MSTNINNNGLPNIDDLQNLANELFKALPNEFPKEISLSPDKAEHPRAVKIAETILHAGNSDQFGHIPAVSPSSVPPAPPAFSGFGASPSVSNYGNTGASALYPNAGAGFNPQNRNSSSGVEENHDLNMNNPHNGFYDSNLKNGNSPQLNEESLFSVFSLNHQYLPFQAENSSFEIELQAALASVDTQFKKREEFPLNGNETANSYYFLDQNPFAFDKRSTDLIVGNSFDHKEIQLFKGHYFDASLVKKDFPILRETVNGKPLVWFDNAATTQKPQSVIDRIAYFYEHENSNIHRAAHELAARASDAYEAAREKVKAFLNAGSVNEIVFVRGATEGINLVASTWGEQNLNSGDEIIVSNLEHHANIVPWKRLADKKGLKLRVIPVDDDGQILLDEYAKLLTSKTRLVAFTQVSNALGTVTPAKKIVEMAHAAGAKVLIDGAQSVSHMKVDVQHLNPDWLVFSGHKLFGPTGIGALYGKEDLLNEMQPYQSGGNMIQDVTFEEIKYHKAPNRFEAGTGNIADAIGLGAAIDYVTKLGIEAIGQYEHYLLEYATRLLKEIPGVRLIGTAKDKASVLSFNLQGYSNDQVGQALNKEGVAVRTGHHCAQPILRRMGVETTVRPSLAFYNTTEDVDTFIKTIWELKKVRF
ncbi:family 2A encapsulin nanocompartment cargo protein cysteine desulfurase [Flavobacterium johnsoniae]|uniref:cysteine desulfurase n=1 Tax=Flavobacterium johnsoniae (strain ATCC 17061 / DSM 2064 / JCM 8514 / BCRC 14874 / CCUG 350202 / NBRC 14942 / NCIMB 11054 / UW101) TaxID=376686 RepID=A5FAW9_FLAJ1|nr:family 2A encapsulin nanocompartment cargo protein cysteine desulfurase [Flavobacterium johnsoniae]ABQ07654.1 cysteine desulfurase, SufS subfamily [Flavobacterium johnsoniae UW101]OXG01740.1 segregation protein B [Flavobacterium johnsoniae UW101]WQG80507.1 family 2A encapsulin nanocompartment cargo protein cysteine desulfurase [Flavobacterium johnsoniae UW101]SHL06501.1 cysteine desulfurase [Flavobacterium johnsoniae]